MGVIIREARRVRSATIIEVDSYISSPFFRFLEVTDKEGNQLWTVTLFERNVDAFITKARNQLKVYVRRMEYNVKAYEEEKQKQSELSEKIKVSETDLKKNCEIVYSALFECLMHLKILRAHVECVLRWGVPPKYFLSLIKATSGKEKKVIQNLIKLFSDTGNLLITTSNLNRRRKGNVWNQRRDWRG